MHVVCSREEITKLKEGEIDKTKTYSALCWCDRELTPADIDMLDAIKVMCVSFFRLYAFISSFNLYVLCCAYF